jgi:type IV pilus assembly protein PilF
MSIKLRSATFLFLCLFVAVIAVFGCAEDKALRKRQAQAKQDLGRTLLAEGNYTAGMGELIDAAAIDPKNPEIQNELALAYREMEMYPKAIEHFNKAVELTPDYSEAYNNLGTVYLILKQWDSAINCFKHALANNLYATPHFAYHNLGLAHYNKGEPHKAIEYYQKAIQVQPLYSRSYHNMGIAFESLGQWEKAIENYKRSIRYAPDNPASYFFLGRLYAKLNKPSLAARNLEETIRLNKHNAYEPEAKRLLKEVK